MMVGRFPYDGPTVVVAGVPMVTDCNPEWTEDGPCFWDDAPGELSCLRHTIERVTGNRHGPVTLGGYDDRALFEPRARLLSQLWGRILSHVQRVVA